MKRNMELVRKLLQHAEDSRWLANDKQPEIDGFSEEEVAYHLKIMREAGLIDAAMLDTSPHPTYLFVTLTWLGHEFLDAAREDSRWKKAMQLVKEKAGSATFDLIKALLTKMAGEKLGLG